MDWDLEHEKRLTAVEESVKHAHRRIDEVKALSEAVNNLTHSMAETNATLTNVKESNERIEARICETDERIHALELKPAKRWEAVIMQIIQLLVAGGLGYVISMLSK